MGRLGGKGYKVKINCSHRDQFKVFRGVHWKGGESDGGGEGTVTRAETSGLVAIKWDNGNFGFYRFSLSLQFYRRAKV